MELTATAIQDAAAAEPVTRVLEMPELASMALLSVVLAGLSIAVRRLGSKRAARRQSQAPAVIAPAAPAAPSHAPASTPSPAQSSATQS